MKCLENETGHAAEEDPHIGATIVIHFPIEVIVGSLHKVLFIPLALGLFFFIIVRVGDVSSQGWWPADSVEVRGLAMRKGKVSLGLAIQAKAFGKVFQFLTKETVRIKKLTMVAMAKATGRYF